MTSKLETDINLNFSIKDYCIYFEVCSDIVSEFSYAFYIKRNDKIIKKFWYSKKVNFEERITKKGNYSVIAFLKDNENRKKIYTSEVIKVKENKILNIGILGSCVTRDAFELKINFDYKLVNYTARTSLASLVAKPLEDFSFVKHINSNFQKKCVTADLNKSYWHTLEEFNLDYLIIDFIDNRFELIYFNDGSAANNSSEYSSVAKFNRLVPKKNIHCNDKYYLKEWIKGYRKLKKISDKKFIKLIFNCPYYITTNDNEFDKKFDINGQNHHLKLLYRILKDEQKITYKLGELGLDKNHKWGQAPFHYSKKSYAIFIKKLENIVTCSL